MKLVSTQLEKHLISGLSSIYLVSGDEPLQHQETTDLIRKSAFNKGFTERLLLSSETKFNWNELQYASDSLSLFSQKKLIEIRLNSNKISDKGASLLSYMQRLSPDIILLISMPKIDAATQKTKWCSTLISNSQAQFIQIWPIDTAQIPQWIEQRLAKAGLTATAEAINLLAFRVEGNLLAAAQEIEKLKLLATDQLINENTVQQLVNDSAKFNLFDLIDTALSGDTEHTLRSFYGLQKEGVEATLILWAIVRELRTLIKLAFNKECGKSTEQSFNSIRPPIWAKRRPLITQALNRKSSKQWSNLLALAQQTDLQIKGQEKGNPWNNLAHLLIEISHSSSLKIY